MARWPTQSLNWPQVVVARAALRFSSESRAAKLQRLASHRPDTADMLEEACPLAAGMQKDDDVVVASRTAFA